jgi:hypothetical protein
MRYTVKAHLFSPINPKLKRHPEVKDPDLVKFLQGVIQDVFRGFIDRLVPRKLRVGAFGLEWTVRDSGSRCRRSYDHHPLSAPNIEREATVRGRRIAGAKRQLIDLERELSHLHNLGHMKSLSEPDRNLDVYRVSQRPVYAQPRHSKLMECSH